MKAKSFSALATGILALAFIGASAPAAEAAERYSIDLVHSNVLFKVKHNNVSYVFGRFNTFEADLQWDTDDPANGSVSFTLQADSVDTNNERRDQHLRSPDFFNARQYPEVTFSSEEIRANGDGSYEVTGEVTLLGETRPLTFTWTETGAGEGPRGDFRRGGIATFTIERSEFGMDYMLDRLSDEVELTVSLQAIRQ